MSNFPQSEPNKNQEIIISELINPDSNIEISSIDLASGYQVGANFDLESKFNAGNALNENSIETLKEKNSNTLNLISSWFVVAIGGITLMALLLLTATSFSNNRLLKNRIENSSEYSEKEKIEQIRIIDAEFRDQETDLFLGIFLLALGYFVGSANSNKE